MGEQDRSTSQNGNYPYKNYIILASVQYEFVLDYRSKHHQVDV